MAEVLYPGAFQLQRGRVPLLISMPHAGLRLTPAVQHGLVDAAQELPDTDWHIPRLYNFAQALGASTLQAGYSRYVIDLNRPADDQPLYTGATTGLYPATIFTGEPLFHAGMTPSDAERERYLEHIWWPYHRALAEELARLKAQFGYALLFDAHSIRSVIEHLFPGRLPDFNLGTNDGRSCGAGLGPLVEQACTTASDYTHVLNGRFKGGYITRHYGQPEHHVHALQLELAQCIYMDESTPFAYREDRAPAAQAVLRKVLETFLAWGASVGNSLQDR